MHDGTEQPQGNDSDLLTEVTFENVADHRAVRQVCTIELVVRHPDVSTDIPIGPWEVKGPLHRVLQKIETGLPQLLRSMEARVPKERGATLALTRDGIAVLGAQVALKGLVRGGQKRG